jgi:hypothetical protein
VASENEAVILAWLLIASPCSGATEMSVLGGDAPPKAECDGMEIAIARACHCLGPKESVPWGSSDDFKLEVTKALTIASGGYGEIQYTLSYVGKEPRVFDTSGGNVIYPFEIRRGKNVVPDTPCAMISALPPKIRLTLKPGAKVTGKLSWRASNYQHAGCDDYLQHLKRGSYTLTFKSASGDPPLTASTTITVK